jgi:hypothetical protein
MVQATRVRRYTALVEKLAAAGPSVPVAPKFALEADVLGVVGRWPVEYFLSRTGCNQAAPLSYLRHDSSRVVQVYGVLRTASPCVRHGTSP